jgi:hypothetical protein
MKRRIFILLFTLMLPLLGFGVAGCKTEDELTARPWNTPQGWETGLPAALTEGR